MRETGLRGWRARDRSRSLTALSYSPRALLATPLPLRCSPYHYARPGPDAAGFNCRLPIPSEHLGSQLYCPKQLAMVGLIRRRCHGPDNGQRAALGSGYPRQHRFAETTGRQFREYSIQPPMSASNFRVYRMLRMLRWPAATGLIATSASPVLGRLPTALSTRIPAKVSPGVRRERRYPPSPKPSRGFLSVSLNDTLAVRGGMTKVAVPGDVVCRRWR